jgi:small subunit ribosomal protein S6
MKYYETLYIVNPDLSTEVYQQVLGKFNGLVETNRGVIIKVDEWGNRPMAYPVKKFEKGAYVLFQYCGEAGISNALERDFRLDDRVLKFQTVKISDHADVEALRRQAEEVKATPAETAPAKAVEPQPQETADTSQGEQ